MTTLEEYVSSGARHQQPEELNAPRAMTLEEYQSLPRDDENPITEGLLEISEAQRKSWEGQGKIGFFEQALREEKSELVPFIPSASIPFNAAAAARSIGLLRATNRLRDGEGDESQRKQDLTLVNKYLLRIEEERIRGYSIGGRITQGVMQLPGYMIEFLAAGPAASGARVGLKTGAQATLKALVKRNVAAAVLKGVRSNAVLRTGAKATGLLAGAVGRTAAAPPVIVKGIADRQTASGLVLTDKGTTLAPEIKEKPMTSAAKVIGDRLIENFSETTGGALTTAAQTTFRTIAPVKLATAMEKVFVKMNPTKRVSELWSKVGVENFLAELGEERVGDLLRAVTGVDDFGTGSGASVFDKVIASIPSGDEWLVEIGVLSVPGALRMGTNQVMDLVQKRKAEDKFKEPELKDIADAQVNAIAADPAEVPAPATPETAATAETVAEIPEAGPQAAPPIPQQIEQFAPEISQNAGNIEALAGEATLEGAAGIVQGELKNEMAKGKTKEEAVAARIEGIETENMPFVLDVDNALDLPKPMRIHLLQSMTRFAEKRALLTGEPTPSAIFDAQQKLQKSIAEDTGISRQVVTFEADPSKKLKEPISSASFEQKKAFSETAVGLIRDKEGRDALAPQLGIEEAKLDVSTGAYEGGINPNAITILKGNVSVEKMNAYARAVQYIYKQDAVPWFRLKKGGSTPAIIIKFSVELTPEREQKFFDDLRRVLTKKAGYTKLSGKEIIVLDFEGVADFDNKVFTLADNNAEIESIRQEQAESEYGPEHDWASDPEGQTLRAAAVREGSPALDRWLGRRRQAFESLLRAFAEKTVGADPTPVIPVSEIRSELSAAQKLLSDFRREQARLGVRGEKSERAETLEARVAELQEALAIREGTQKIDKPREEKAVGKFAALKEVLRAEARAATLAAQLTKKEIKTTQTNLVTALESSKLTPEDRAKFIRTIKNIQTQQQLIDELPGIADRVERLIEASARRNAINAIKKELKKIAPKKDKPGKFTPGTQEALSRMKAALRLSPEEARKRLEELLSPEKMQFPNPVESLEGMMLNFVANSEDISAAELENILETVRALKLSGKVGKKVKQLAQQEELDEQKQAINSIVASAPPGGVRVSAESQDFTRNWAWWTRATSWLMGWNNLLNRVSWNDKKTKTNQSKVNELMNVSVEKTQERKLNRKDQEFIHREFRKAYGPEMTAWQVEQEMVKNSEQKDLGTFVDARGEAVKILISKGEAQSLWLQMKDPSLRETFFGIEGRAMAYTEDIRNAIDKFLGPADKQFAVAVFGFYNKERGGKYDQFNAVFSDMMGYNLTKNDFYTPIQRKFESREADEADQNQILGEVAHRNSTLPSAGKRRVANLRPIKQVDIIENFMRHTAQVNHYIAWAKKIRQLRSIMSNEQFRESIKKGFGGDILKLMDGFVEDFTRGGIDRSREMANFNAIKNNIVVATLALKPALTAKQLVSFAAFWDSIPVEHFIGGVGSFIANPKRAIKILSTSELLRTRGVNITPELGEAARSKESLLFKQSPTITNFLLFNVKFGDKGAIFLGGWSVYRYHRDILGKSHKESIKAFEDAFDSSQQSPDLDQASFLQRGNSLQRAMGVFMSSQNQYLRKEIAATDDFLAGRIGFDDFAKTIAIYHFILPMLFQFVASGFRFDWKEQARAAAIGSLNGWFIVGDLLIGMASTLLGLRAFPQSGIIDSSFRGARSAWREVRDGDADLETMIKVLKELSKPAGLVTGVPTPAVIGLIEGSQMLMDADEPEEYLKALKRMAGWSNFVLDGGENPNKKGSAF